MKIIHIATNDIQGGAARAANRLHAGLLKIGIDSEMFVENKRSSDSTVSQYQAPRDLATRIKRRFRAEQIVRDYQKYKETRPLGLELFTDSRSRFRESFGAVIQKADVVNLHWVAGFVDYDRFFRSVPPGKPVVWTLHDMNALTGGCHYANGCRKFETACGACPQLGSRRSSDLARKIWRDKEEAYRYLKNSQLHIVTPSRWLGEEAACSALLKRFDRSVIPYGLDTEIFRPREKETFKEALGIPRGARIVGFVSDTTLNNRKGFSLLLEALEKSCSENIYLVSIGQGNPPIVKYENHIHLGRVSIDGLLSLVYSAFDVFCCPSLEDNLPNTVLESLACGTPVVGFPVGGMPDMIVSGETGLLADKMNSAALGDALKQVLADDKKLNAMSVKCREYAESRYSLRTQAEGYINLYRSLSCQA